MLSTWLLKIAHNTALCGHDRESWSRASESCAAISGDSHPIGRYQRLLPDPITPSTQEIRKEGSDECADTHDKLYNDGRARKQGSSTLGSFRGSFTIRLKEQRSNRVIMCACRSYEVLIFLWGRGAPLISSCGTVSYSAHPRCRIYQTFACSSAWDRADQGNALSYTRLAILQRLKDFSRLTTTQHSTDDMPPCWMSTFSVRAHAHTHTGSIERNTHWRFKVRFITLLRCSFC